MIKSENKTNSHFIYSGSKKFKFLEGIDKYAQVNVSFRKSFVNDSTSEIKYNLSEEDVYNSTRSVKEKRDKALKLHTIQITPELARQIQERANNEGVSVDEFLNKISVKTKQRNRIKDSTTITKTKDKVDLSESRKWLKENRHKYLGKWVVLNGNKLIGAGENPQPYVEKARVAGVKIPFVKYIEDNTEPFTGGWL